MKSRSWAGLWLLAPQAVSRLESLYVFAVVANRVTADQLGALALATAFTTFAYALAPAIVGKPLATAEDGQTRVEFGALGRSFAIIASLAAAALLVPAAAVTTGLIRLAFASAVVGIPSVMVVESSYWRSVFVSGPRAAGMSYCLSYLAQAAIVTVAAVWVHGEALVLALFAGLVPAALTVALQAGDITFAGAKRWFTRHRRLWTPYVIGDVAGLGLVQAIPVVVSATAGFAATSAYRAGELAFGLTNLLMSVSVQTMLTQGVEQPRRSFVRVSGTLVVLAALNGLAVELVPRSLLRTFIGPATPLLIAVILIVTVQRAALAVSSVGSILLLTRVSPRRYAALDIGSAVISLTMLITGGVVDGLRGALSGLAAAEIVFGVICAILLRRRT